MPAKQSHAEIKAKRLQAEQIAKELLAAEMNAAFQENQMNDPAYLAACRLRSKQRQLTQAVRHRLGRKKYSIKVQLEKIDQSRTEERKLTELLNKHEAYLAELEQQACKRREAVYQTLGA